MQTAAHWRTVIRPRACTIGHILEPASGCDASDSKQPTKSSSGAGPMLGSRAPVQSDSIAIINAGVSVWCIIFRVKYRVQM